MTYPIFIFVAIAGAAILGFILAWSIQRRKLRDCKMESEELAAEVRDQITAFNRLKTEAEAQQLSINNLQHLLQEVENQSFETENELKQLRLEHRQLEADYQKLMEKSGELPPEIEVIREVPVLVFRDTFTKDDKREKAKKLVKAFKKGYLQENQKSIPPQH